MFISYMLSRRYPETSLTSCFVNFFMSLVRLLSLAGLLCHCIVVGLSLQDSPTSPANNLPYASKYFQDAQSYFLEFENEAASKGQDGSS